jgi:type VI protein secretion system component VasF
MNGVTGAVQAKLLRIRGAAPAALVPDWQLPMEETVVLGRDPWARRLSYITGGALLFALVLYVVYRLLLASGVAELQALV